jgi:hypothetical protein
MARQFREQLEEEVQLEQARKAQRAASPPPAEPVAAADPPETHANGGAAEVTPETFAHHEGGTGGADPNADRPAPASGADERRT